MAPSYRALSMVRSRRGFPNWEAAAPKSSIGPAL